MRSEGEGGSGEGRSESDERPNEVYRGERGGSKKITAAKDALKLCVHQKSICEPVLCVNEGLFHREGVKERKHSRHSDFYFNGEILFLIPVNLRNNERVASAVSQRRLVL